MLEIVQASFKTTPTPTSTMRSADTRRHDTQLGGDEHAHRKHHDDAGDDRQLELAAVAVWNLSDLRIGHTPYNQMSVLNPPKTHDLDFRNTRRSRERHAIPRIESVTALKHYCMCQPWLTTID